MPYVPAAFGFHPGTPLFQPTAVLPHPYITGHPAGAQSFHHQPLFFTSAAGENVQSSAFYPAHAQANFTFPFLLASSMPTTMATTTATALTTTPSTISDNSDSSVFTYSTTTSASVAAAAMPATTSTMDNSTYPA